MMDSSEAGPAQYALSADQIQEFVDRGFIILRGALDPAWVDRFRQEVLADVTRLETRADCDYDLAGVDIEDRRTWPHTRLCIETGRAVDIESVSPRLWGAMRSLLGTDREPVGRSIGTQFIVNGEAPRPGMDLHSPLSMGGSWHIDSTSAHSRLTGRHDGLTLLILWSRVRADGGGTLVSGESLDHVVAALEAAPEGVDTTGYRWGGLIASKCGDIFAFTGEPGDVLISHPLALHTGQPNVTGALRVLENPTIMVSRELDFHPDNPAPSPVERAVIQRLRNPAAAGVDIRPHLERAARLLAATHPDYLLPGRASFDARVTPAQRSAVSKLDAALWDAWSASTVAAVAEREPDPTARVEALTAIVAETLINGRTAGLDLHERADDEVLHAQLFGRLLTGLVSEEVQNAFAALLLGRLFDDVALLRLPDDSSVVRIHTPADTIWANAAAPPHLLRTAPDGSLEVLQPTRFTQLLGEASSGERRQAVDPRGATPVRLPVAAAPPLPLADVDAASLGPAAPRVAPVWRDYLEGRVLMLAARREEAMAVFREVRRSLPRGNTTSDTARCFEDRLRLSEPALDVLAPRGV